MSLRQDDPKDVAHVGLKEITDADLEGVIILVDDLEPEVLFRVLSPINYLEFDVFPVRHSSTLPASRAKSVI